MDASLTSSRGYAHHRRVLEALGMSGDEEQAYAWLVDKGPTPLVEVSAQLSGPSGSTDVEVLLASLESRGLISRLPGPPSCVVACAPAVTLEQLALNQEEALHRARINIAELQDRYRLASQRDTAQELVEIVWGREAVDGRTRLLLDSVREEFRGFDKPPYFAESITPNQAELQLLDQGIRCRCVYDPRSLEIPGYLQTIEKMVLAGEQARVATVPMKLGIADRQLALLPLQSDATEAHAELFVHASGLLDALVELFESVYARAEPLTFDLRTSATGDELTSASPEGGPTNDDRRLLAMLAAGIPDDSISRQLGVSHRTFQRRLHNLENQLNASTRFQLALHACRKGWLNTNDQ